MAILESAKTVPLGFRAAADTDILKQRGLYLCLVLLCILSASSRALARESYVTSECALKTAFIYQFTKYVKWPWARDEKKVLVIGVMAGKDMSRAVSRLDGQRSLGMEITVRVLKDGSEISGLDMLYVEKGHFTDSKLVEEAVKHNVLTISDEEDAVAKGIVIGLFRTDSKLRFDINMKIAKQSKLKLSSRLLRLANKLVK